MSSTDFSALILSQAWGGVELQYDGWYQYAVCEKDREALTERQTQTITWEAV
jgi:hypothetical protein